MADAVVDTNGHQIPNTYETTQHEDDFDTQLLCPDVIIEEKNDAIVTGDDNIDEFENSCSPLDYNITGVKAQFSLNEAEDIIRSDLYKMGHQIQKTKIHCTACNAHLGSAVSNLDNVFVHPLLLVLVCRDCFDYYTGGHFEKDEDGTEKYCRWCGQGGQVFCCSKCPMVFCKLCIRINFTSAQYSAIRDSEYWECFSCDPSQIISLKVQCYEFAKYVHSEYRRLQNVPESNFYMEIDHSQCCLNDNRKRKYKNNDPDFVPNADDKNVKHPKIPKREEIEALKFADFENNMKLIQSYSASTPETATGATSHSSNIQENLSLTSTSSQENSQATTNLIQNINQNKNPSEYPNVHSLSQISTPHLPLYKRQLQMNFPYHQNRFTLPPPPPISLYGPPVFRNTPVTPSRQVFKMESRYLRKSREMDKHLLSVALVNSTFASTMLKIYQMSNEKKTVQDLLVIYDTLQKSLKMVTESLVDVKIQMHPDYKTGNPVAPGAPKITRIPPPIIPKTN